MTSCSKIRRSSLLLAAALAVGIATASQACVLPQVVGQSGSHPTPCGHGGNPGGAGTIHIPNGFNVNFHGAQGEGSITVPGTVNGGSGDGSGGGGGGGTGSGGKCPGVVDGYCYNVQ